MKLFNLFKHECKFNRIDVIMCEHKDAYGRIFYKYMGIYPAFWDEVKDIQPRCIKCGKQLDKA